MTTQITNNHEKIIAGLNKAAEVIKSTMGAAGKTVVIADGNKLRYTKDGISVAKSIVLEDPIENIGAQILISAANETVEATSDGTTLTSLLTQSFVNSMTDHIKEFGNINEVIMKTRKYLRIILSQLKQKSRPVKNTIQIEQIAAVSGNSETIGKLFKEIYDETKDFDTNINVEKMDETQSETYYQRLKGLHFSNNTGYIHPSFLTNKDTEQCIYENPFIYITTDAIKTVTPEFEEMFEVSYKTAQPVVIIAPKFSDSFMRLCSMNKVNQGIQICLVKLPGFGHGQQKNMEDIVSYLSEDYTVDKIVIDPINLNIYNDNTPRLDGHLNTLTKLKEHALDDYDRDDYSDRIYKLKQSKVTIFVGGNNPEAQSEEYDRIEDANGAVQSAIEKGFLPGAGIALYRLDSESEIIRTAIRKPYLQILSNANITLTDKQLIGTDTQGFNVKTKKNCDLITEGIIDPTKVVTSALLNAFGAAKLLVNTSYILYNK